MVERDVVKKGSFSMSGKGRGQKVNVNMAIQGHRQKSKFQHVLYRACS
jgi:hypothetical protein